MSEYWFLHCRTCGTDDDRAGYWNHGVDRGLREVIPMLPLIAAVARANTGVVRIEFEGPEDTSGLADFALAHGDHEVVCRSEYGRFDDRCGEFYHCICGRTEACEQLKGHAGSHSTQKRAEWAGITAAKTAAAIVDEAYFPSHVYKSLAAILNDQLLGASELPTLLSEDDRQSLKALLTICASIDPGPMLGSTFSAGLEALARVMKR